MKRFAFLLPSLCFVLTACPGDGGGGGANTDTDSDDDDDSTTGSGTVTLSTTASTTEMPTATDMPTTDPSSESGLPECTVDDECILDEDCPLPGATCTACFCTGGAGCKMYGPGAFGDCLNDNGTVDISTCMGSMNPGCVVDNPGNATAGVCFSTCKETCDCPAPPAGFEAQLTCGQLVDPAGNCYITCENGESCPDGWQCVQNYFCAAGEPVLLPGYGDCANLGGTCPPEPDDGAGICLTGIPGMMDESTGPGAVCSTGDCADADDCPVAPGTGTATVACDQLTMAATNNCYLNCADGATCPDGMVCQTELPNPICYWETIFLDPYGECIAAEVGVCPEGPTGGVADCLSTEEVSFCTNACAGADDCPAGPSGTAVPACINIAMDDYCVLDCAGGATCPDGMMCADLGDEICVNDIP